jgi:tetratricopeptide (TPR) repeat protein
MRETRGETMPEVSLTEVPRKTREIVEKATMAVERGNTDYAIEILLSVLDAEPRLLEARRILRKAQIQKFLNSGRGASYHAIATMTSLGSLLMASLQLRSKPLKALQVGERLMCRDPFNPPFFNLVARAAVAADLLMTAIETLEAVREARPNDVGLLMTLADLYSRADITDKARECYDRLAALRPNDPKVIKGLRDAQARDTMRRGRWESAQSYRDLIKDEKEAQRLEQLAKAAKTEKDVQDLIEDHLEKIRREPNNINYRRALADLYVRVEQFDKALETLQEADRISGGGDPQLARALTQVRIRQYDAEIARRRAAGDETGAQAVEKEKAEFVFNDAEDRVRRYPNDLQFRYEYGVLLFERGRYLEAIEQFQQSQRNPQRRTRSLYYLARCFEAKGQYDLAAEQLEKAAAEIAVMDETKKDILYELSLVYEKLGQPEKAVELLKEIYAADVRYKDVAERIDRYYKSSAQRPPSA